MQDFVSYGVPCFYMNVPVTEQAGGGNVRIWNCVRKNGMIIPVCEIIIPAVELISATRIINSAAMETFKMERATTMNH